MTVGSAGRLSRSPKPDARCSRNHRASPTRRWKVASPPLEGVSSGAAKRLDPTASNQDHKHLLNIQTDANEIS